MRASKIMRAAAGVAVITAAVITLTVFLKINKNQPSTPAAEQGNEMPASSPTIDVIEYQGKFIPVSEVIMVFEPMGCPEPHWHTRRQSATALDGSTVIEPADECGLGTDRELPVKTINDPAYQK